MHGEWYAIYYRKKKQPRKWKKHPSESIALLQKFINWTYVNQGFTLLPLTLKMLTRKVILCYMFAHGCLVWRLPAPQNFLKIFHYTTVVIGHENIMPFHPIFKKVLRPWFKRLLSFIQVKWFISCWESVHSFKDIITDFFVLASILLRMILFKIFTHYFILRFEH